MILVIGGAFQGKREFVEQELHCGAERIVDHFHETIRTALSGGKDPAALLRALLEERPDAVILCDEVGLGVVPLERTERDYREAVGRTMQLAAKEAEAVYRVICGIGERIK